MSCLPPLLALLLCASSSLASGPWNRHTIDCSSRGADGARLLDVNGDGLLDVTTAWEEGNVVRAYLHPGHADVRQPWPAVTVGQVQAGEDAVFVDLDGNGAFDVVSSTEGKSQTVFVHWAPTDRSCYLDPAAWTTQPISATVKLSRWMFAVAAQVDGRQGVDLVVGSKGPGGMIGWLESPSNPRDIDAWKLHPIYRAGWIMSVLPADMNGNGLLDILASDRKGENTGAKWLENPGPGPAQKKPWREHKIGGEGLEVMFLARADLDGDGLEDIVAAVRPDRILAIRRLNARGTQWHTRSVSSPPADRAGTPKSVAVGDIRDDGKLDLVMSCESADKDRSGVWCMQVDWFADDPRPVYHDVSGPDGVKFDLVKLVDLDGDGDLDILTCEENAKLGVIWYENPTR